MTQLFFSVLGALRGGGSRWWCREDEQVFWRLNLGKMGLETLRLAKMKLLKGYQCTWLCVVFECWGGLNPNVPYRHSYLNTWSLVGGAVLGRFRGCGFAEGRLWGFKLHRSSRITVSVLCLSTRTAQALISLLQLPDPPAAITLPPPHDGEGLIPLESLTNPSFCKPPWQWFLLADKGYLLTKA